MTKKYDALALFSGGLDSILAIKIVEEQGLKVLGLHFCSPFFGHPDRIAHWKEIYGLDIDPVFVGDEYLAMMKAGPKFGYGSALNPCVDCKIFMLSWAKRLLPDYGAKFLISGEVVGQRPMSQRRDALNSIRRDAGVADLLLRPLCAKNLEPTPMEESGLVDRERLYAASGRGRKLQLELAEKYGLKEIPTPAGGCTLTEKESSKRFFPVFRHSPEWRARDFDLANTGRQYWAGEHWLAIGRHRADNARLEKLAEPTDLVFNVVGHPGPLTIGRQFPGKAWSGETIRDAAAFAASFSPKAVKAGGEVKVRVACGGETSILMVVPGRETPLGWRTPEWEEARTQKDEVM